MVGVIKIRARFCQYVVYWGRIRHPNVSKSQAKKIFSEWIRVLYLKYYYIVFFGILRVNIYQKVGNGG